MGSKTEPQSYEQLPSNSGASSAAGVATVGEIKALLSGIPDDMPVFEISDYWGTCEPHVKGFGPTVEEVHELEFPHGRSFHHGARDGLIEHTLIRSFLVLNL